MEKNKKEGQKGVVIIFTAILLGILVSIALGLAAIFTPKVRLINEVRSSAAAFFAAESGLEWCLYINQIAPSPTPAPPVMLNGATYQLTPANCSGATIKSVGNYQGVTRALQVDFP